MARKVLRTVSMVKKMPDGPTDNLIKVMEAYDFKAPDDWPGYRQF